MNPISNRDACQEKSANLEHFAPHGQNFVQYFSKCEQNFTLH